MKKDIPQPLWISVIFLGAMVLGKLAAVGEAGPLVLIDAALSAVLLVGLVRGYEWAYVLTLVAALGGTVWGVARGIQFGWSILAVDCLVLIPVLICTDYYFPRRELQPQRSRVNRGSMQVSDATRSRSRSL
jgi:hypothetical protein